METSKKTPKCKVKFYADAPDGTKNKILNYCVHDLSHATDLLNRFVADGWKLRMAYFEFENGRNISLKTMLPSFDGNLTTTYSATKELNEKLDEKFKDLIPK